jgi:hypothetical protein
MAATRSRKPIRALRRGAGYNSFVVRSLLGVIYAHVGLDRRAIGELKRAPAGLETARALDPRGVGRTSLPGPAGRSRGKVS